MKILFMHNNFPGQYRRIEQFIKPMKDVQAAVATLETNAQKQNLKTVTYKPHRDATQGIHPALIATERAVLMGHAAYNTLLPPAKKGYKPDIILSHSGWGANMFLKDIFPDSKLLTYYEWYYHGVGTDADFLKQEPESDPNTLVRVRMKNTPILQDLAAMDWGQSPTYFQRSQFPDLFHDRISVLHDGVDTRFFSPAENPKDVKVKIGDVTLSGEDEVITYVARGMEPYRGFPQFIEAVAELQKQRPNLHVVMLGNDRAAYGSKRDDGKTYKEWALETFDLDLSRLHMPGLQPLETFRDLMRITKAHVYLTVPFVLSWSLMEAMGAGALIIGSDTDPLKEVVTDGENGLLVPFFEPSAIVEAVIRACDDPAGHMPLRQKARETILERYDTEKLLPQYWDLIQSVANGSQK